MGINDRLLESESFYPEEVYVQRIYPHESHHHRYHHSRHRDRHHHHRHHYDDGLYRHRYHHYHHSSSRSHPHPRYYEEDELVITDRPSFTVLDSRPTFEPVVVAAAPQTYTTITTTTTAYLPEHNDVAYIYRRSTSDAVESAPAKASAPDPAPAAQPSQPKPENANIRAPSMSSINAVMADWRKDNDPNRHWRLYHDKLRDAPYRSL